MNLPGNSAGGKTPPWSQNQTQLQWPGQPHVTANNESHIINEPSLPLHDAGGTRAPPSWSQQSQLRIQEPSQESHVINEPFQPPHHAAGGRIPPPPPSRQHGIQELGQPPPFRVNNESLITVRPLWRPLYSAGQRTSLESFQDQQHSLRVNQESHTIKKRKRPLRHASGGQCPHYIVKNHKEFKELVQRLTGQRSSSGTPLGQGWPRKSSSSTPPTTTSQSPAVPKTPPFVGHDDIGNNSIPVTVSPTVSEILADIESATAALDEDKLSGTSSSSSSTSLYGLSQVPNTLLSNQSNDPLSCAKCGNTSTTQWRNGPRGPKSPCNACGIRFNRKEETKAATSSVSLGFQSSNILLPPGMSLPAAQSFEQEAPYGFSHLQNRVQLMDNISENSLSRFLSELKSSSVVSPPPEISAPAAPSLASRVQLAENILLGDPSRSQSSSPSRDPPEVASMMEEFRQSLTDKTPYNSPGP